MTPMGVTWQGGYQTPSAVPTTWNPSDKDAAITLSGGNLIASASSADRMVRSISSKASGKCYWEYKYTAGAWVDPGFANSTASLANWVGVSLNGFQWNGDGTLYTNNASLATINTYVTNDWIGLAVDFTAELFWGKNITDAGNWNNNGSANPATGVGGVSFASMNAGPWFAATSMGASASLTANFGGSAYAGTAPSGFGNL